MQYLERVPLPIAKVHREDHGTAACRRGAPCPARCGREGVHPAASLYGVGVGSVVFSLSTVLPARPLSGSRSFRTPSVLPVE